MSEKSLAEWAGLPIRWSQSGAEIEFSDLLSVKETKSRLRGALQPVLPDHDSCEPVDAIQYWMYNGISLAEHADTFERLGIQYELTLLYPQRLGKQRSKTLGHIHTYPAEKHLNYAEVCEVLFGEAWFVFQTLDVEHRAADFCYAVHATPGDKVVFPPNLHHLTINAGDSPLLFSDLISVETRGNYTGLSTMGGAAHLYGADGWYANLEYARTAPLTLYEAEDYPALKLTKAVPLYRLVELNPAQLNWLNDPDLFARMFPELWKRVQGVV